MKLLDIIDKTAFCSIGCIVNEKNIETLEEYLSYNYPVISKFSKIIVAHTKTDNISDILFEKYNNTWNTIFGDKCIVIHRPNFGHTFGFTDLDSTVLLKSKELGFLWSLKSTNDMLLTDNILSTEIDDSKFLYLQGHGITGIMTYYKGNVDSAVNNFKDNGYEYFFPQTNFYIISNEIDFLIDPNKFNELYNKCITDPDYNKNKVQTEYKYILCECVLRDCVIRNNLKSKHLLSKDGYKRLLEIIMYYNIADSSHKNIFFTECGICHYHFKDQTIMEL